MKRGDAPADFIRRHGPWALLLIPILASALVSLASRFAGEFLITSYLLRLPPLAAPPAMVLALGCLEAATLAASVFFLFPFFRANKNRNQGIESSFVTARTRMYNFPMFLIGITWGFWTAATFVWVYFLPADQPRIPFIAGSIFATVLSAIISFYAADLLNRQILIPYWFSDGKIRVSFRFRSPSLFLRFFDMFLVAGIFPALTLTGLIFLTMQHGRHDSEELLRLLHVSLAMSCIYWGFGLILTTLNAVVFTQPLAAMARAVEEFGNENFEARVTVQSDDMIGRLQGAVNHMGSEMRDKRLIKTLFGHYVSPAIRDLILDGRVNTAGDRIEAVILFTDIRSFTALSEAHPPEKVIQLLNLHFSRVVDTVSENFGFVDKFIGDAVMAVFDSEFCSGMHRLCALKAAAEILGGVAHTNLESEALGFGPISIGVGIACGDVIRGNVGSASRRELTVIGDTVNTASRLESATRELGLPLLITENSYDHRCAELQSLRIEQRTSLRLRGKEDAVSVIGLVLSGLP